MSSFKTGRDSLLTGLCLIAHVLADVAFIKSVTALHFQVHLQTQQEARVRMIGMTVNVVRREGYLALYSGLSASICRQVEKLHTN